MSQCLTLLTQLSLDYYIRGVWALFDLPKETIEYSGKALNDLGFYDPCLASGFNYALINIQVLNLPNQFNWGICIPSYCAVSDLTQFQGFLKQLINTSIGESLVSSITIIDPLQVYPKFNVLTGFVLAIFIIVVTLSIIGSLVSINNKYKPTTDNKLTHFVKCFSFYDNFNKLWVIKEDGKYRIFNGIRAISISWIVYGHTFLIIGFQTTQLGNFARVLSKPGWLTLSPAGYYAVDVFFFMGGFLTCVVLSEKLLKMNRISPLLVPGLYLHRFLRIWPTYMFCLFCYWQLTPFIGNGPLWYAYTEMTGFCNSQFWENMLLIDNLFNHVFDYCYAWGWYLSNDFQIFMIAPPLLILYKYNKMAAEVCTWLLLVLSLTASYIIVYLHDYHLNYPTPGGTPQLDYMSVYYYKPWIRAAPYFMGLLYAYWHIRGNEFVENLIRNNKLVRLLMMVSGIAMIQFVVWIIIPLQGDPDAWTHQEQYLYQTFGRVIFILGLILLIQPSMIGINDPISKILSWNGFVPLARISFCVYLVHFFIILLFTQQFRQMQYFQPLQTMLYSMAFIIASFVMGGIVSLSVEVPLMNLLKQKQPKIDKPIDEEQELVQQQQ